MFNSITIVGVGLISGSFALALKEKGYTKHVIGVSRTKASEQKAIELGIIDEALPLEEAVKKSDLIYVAIPVDVTIPVMQQIMKIVPINRSLLMQAHKICFVQSRFKLPHASRFVPRILCGARNTADRKLQ